MKSGKHFSFRRFCLVALACALLLPFSIPQKQAAAAGASVKGFYVSDTNLVDATGSPFVMRGVNHAHTRYKKDLATAIPAIAATGSNTVRIVLSNGSKWSLDSLSDVKNILALCDQYKLTAMLEVHDATGSDNASDLNAAVNYWISFKDAIISFRLTLQIETATAKDEKTILQTLDM